MKRLTHEKYLAKLVEVNPNVNVVGEYINQKTKICVSCRKCGKIIEVFPSNLFSHSGLCRECSSAQTRKSMKTHEEFINEMKTLHPNTNIIGLYRGAANRIEWICSNCGEHRFSFPSNLLRPSANGLCKKCNSLRASNARQKDHNTFVHEVAAIHPEIRITGIYQGNNRKIEYECAKCGKKLHTTPSNLLKPNRTPFCKPCFAKIRSTIPIVQSDGSICSSNELNAKRFYEALSKRNQPPILLSEYHGVSEKLHLKCSVCGFEWFARPNDVLYYKHACPKCADRNHTLTNDEFRERLASINPYIIPLEE